MEDKLKRSIKVIDLPPGFNHALIIEELSKAGEIDEHHIGPNEILVTYKLSEGKEASFLYDGIEIGSVKLKIEMEPTSLEVGQDSENRTSYQKLEEIPMTTSSWDFNQQPIFLAHKEKIENKIHDDQPKKPRYDLDQSNVIVSAVLGSDILVTTSNSNPSEADKTSYYSKNVIKEEPEDAVYDSQKFDKKVKDIPVILEREILGENRRSLVSKIQEMNVAPREELPKKDKFHNVTSKTFLLIFSATWAFAWFVSSF